MPVRPQQTRAALRAAENAAYFYIWAAVPVPPTCGDRDYAVHCHMACMTAHIVRTVWGMTFRHFQKHPLM